MESAASLLVMSAIAFRQGQIDEAGRLFTLAMSVDDADELVDSLLQKNSAQCSALASAIVNEDDAEKDLNAIASQVSESAVAQYKSLLREELLSDEEMPYTIEAADDEDDEDEDEDDGLDLDIAGADDEDGEEDEGEESESGCDKHKSLSFSVKSVISIDD